jgi:hypothetical protein
MGSQTYCFSTVNMYFLFLLNQSLDEVPAGPSQSDGEWDFDAALMEPSTLNTYAVKLCRPQFMLKSVEDPGGVGVSSHALC